MASGLFIEYWGGPNATIAVLTLVIGVIIISFVASYFRKKRIDRSARKLRIPLIRPSSRQASDRKGTEKYF